MLQSYCHMGIIRLLHSYIDNEWINSPLPVFILYPSCLHTTVAKRSPKRTLHTVPHTPLMQTSTLPALSRGPLTKRSVSLVQCWAAVVGEMHLCRVIVTQCMAYCGLAFESETVTRSFIASSSQFTLEDEFTQNWRCSVKLSSHIMCIKIINGNWLTHKHTYQIVQVCLTKLAIRFTEDRVLVMISMITKQVKLKYAVCDPSGILVIRHPNIYSS